MSASAAGGRVFVAIDVGDAVRAEVTRVCAAIDAAVGAAKAPPRIVWVAPRALHLTLRFVGEVDATGLARLRGLIAPPIALAPFAVRWRGLGAFPGPRHPRALWLGLVDGADALGRLEAEVSRRLDGAIADHPHPFRPHVTIGRVKADGAGVDWTDVLERINVSGVRSMVDHVTLYRSELWCGL